ncbi:MAG: hypothetical protein N2C14_17820 [Planctomycetales bacterium]
MAKRKSSIQCRWRIVSMSAWDDEYLDEEGEAFIEFSDRNQGEFRFGYIGGEIEYRTTRRDRKLAVEFSWEGGDAADGTPMTGRGWAVLDDGELVGELFIHQGEESEFRARKE